MTRLLTIAVLWGSVAHALAETAPKPKTTFDATGYHTTATARTADPKTFKMTAEPAAAGVLGIEVATDEQNRVVIDDVLFDSAAAAAGLKVGDVINGLNGELVKSATVVRDKLRGRTAGEELTLTIDRGTETLTLTATLKPASKPFKLTSAERPVLGVQLEAAKAGGITITSVTPGGGADKAGLKTGDVVTRIDDKPLEDDNTFRELIGQKKAGDVVKLFVKRAAEELELRATLASDTGGRFGRPIGWDDRLPRAWRKPTYNLAIIGIDYPDVKHNPKIPDAAWQASMFSRGTYTDKSATGDRVYGSMADYYAEISYGQFVPTGNFLGWFEVTKKRAEYSSGNGTSTREKSALLTETLDKVLSVKGKDALKDYDGVFFLFAGDRFANVTRGSLYWPHRANVSHLGKSWPYFIVQEGGNRMNDISVFCHEFGHMLGLPDLYARPEVPGMEGVGGWCAMSQQNPRGRPQHFSAWCKQELGWITPTIIDPRVKQKLILSPITQAKSECFKVPIRADGSEYFLLENRIRKGFDSDLPADGLLVWRVMPGRGSQPVYLEESHGIEGPAGPRAFGGAVPYPSPANTAFTPFTTPSSKSQIGNGFDVHLTNIRRLPDGRIAFHIGYEYQ